MGNQASSSGSGARSPEAPTSGTAATTRGGGGVRHLFKATGTLGLSKGELDRMCQPSGLYPNSPWDRPDQPQNARQLRRWIGDGKLAPRLRGTEHRTRPTDQECPICFLMYSQWNATDCCRAAICTECYLQVRPPGHGVGGSKASASTPCPFCNQPKLAVRRAEPLAPEDVRARHCEEQRIIEAQLRARRNNEKKQGDCDGDDHAAVSATTTNGEAASADATPAAPALPASSAAKSNGFGSSLRESERVLLMRARSSSVTSEGDVSEGDLSSVAATVQERAALEEELRAQSVHPALLRLQREEEDRRARNDLEHWQRRRTEQRERQQQRRDVEQLEEDEMGNRSGRVRRRDWNRIVRAFESGSNGSAVNSLDDLVVLEAAIMLSMEEEERQRSGGGGGGRRGSGGGDNAFDAARHARAGFPLARARAASRRANVQEEEEQEDEREDDMTRFFRQLSGGSAASRPRRMARLPPASDSMEGSAAALLMRGLSEEEQLAMAIAASLQDQSHPSNAGNDDGDGDEAQDTAEAAAETTTTSEPAANTDATAPAQRETQQTQDESIGAANGVPRGPTSLETLENAIAACEVPRDNIMHDAEEEISFDSSPAEAQAPLFNDDNDEIPPASAALARPDVSDMTANTAPAMESTVSQGSESTLLAQTGISLSEHSPDSELPDHQTHDDAREMQGEVEGEAVQEEEEGSDATVPPPLARAGQQESEKSPQVSA